MEEMQLEIGVSTSFLHYSHDAYGPLATRTWIAETWRFLSESKIKVMDPFDKPKLACPEDYFLMERCFAHSYRGKELMLLSTCHMHLVNALCLSDVCMADGRHLTDKEMKVETDPQCSSPFSWPRTHRPEFQTRSFGALLYAKSSRTLLLPKC